MLCLCGRADSCSHSHLWLASLDFSGCSRTSNTAAQDKNGKFLTVSIDTSVLGLRSSFGVMVTCCGFNVSDRVEMASGSRIRVNVLVTISCRLPAVILGNGTRQIFTSPIAGLHGGKHPVLPAWGEGRARLFP